MALISSPFASTALLHDTLPLTPMIEASPGPPSRLDSATHIRPFSDDKEASAHPIESSRTRLASCTMASGRSSNCAPLANLAKPLNTSVMVFLEKIVAVDAASEADDQPRRNADGMALCRPGPEADHLIAAERSAVSFGVQVGRLGQRIHRR